MVSKGSPPLGQGAHATLAEMLATPEAKAAVGLRLAGDYVEIGDIYREQVRLQVGDQAIPERQGKEFRAVRNRDLKLLYAVSAIPYLALLAKESAEWEQELIEAGLEPTFGEDCMTCGKLGVIMWASEEAIKARVAAARAEIDALRGLKAEAAPMELPAQRRSRIEGERKKHIMRASRHVEAAYTFGVVRRHEVRPSFIALEATSLCRSIVTETFATAAMLSVSTLFGPQHGGT